jgi:hypothetical protein
MIERKSEITERSTELLRSLVNTILAKSSGIPEVLASMLPHNSPRPPRIGPACDRNHERGFLRRGGRCNRFKDPMSTLEPQTEPRIADSDNRVGKTGRDLDHILCVNRD